MRLLHQEMRKLILKAGIKNYDEISDFDEEQLSILLQELRAGVYAEVERIWNLHPEDRWEMYEHLGSYLEEMRLLQRALEKLRKAWRHVITNCPKKSS